MRRAGVALALCLAAACTPARPVRKGTPVSGLFLQYVDGRCLYVDPGDFDASGVITIRMVATSTCEERAIALADSERRRELIRVEIDLATMVRFERLERQVANLRRKVGE